MNMNLETSDSDEDVQISNHISHNQLKKKSSNKINLINDDESSSPLTMPKRLDVFSEFSDLIDSKPSDSESSSDSDVFYKNIEKEWWEGNMLEDNIILVRNIDPALNDLDLLSLFLLFGKVRRMRFYKPKVEDLIKSSSLSKDNTLFLRNCLIEYKLRENAVDALQYLNGVIYGKKKLYVELVLPIEKEENPSPQQILVVPKKPLKDKYKLIQIFQRDFGDLCDILEIKINHQERLGYFLTLGNYDQCENVINMFNSNKINIHSKWKTIEYSAQSKERLLNMNWEKESNNACDQAESKNKNQSTSDHLQFNVLSDDSNDFLSEGLNEKRNHMAIREVGGHRKKNPQKEEENPVELIDSDMSLENNDLFVRNKKKSRGTDGDEDIIKKHNRNHEGSTIILIE